MRSALVILAFGCLCGEARAQAEEDNDTLRGYSLGEITVRADSLRAVTPATVQQITQPRLSSADATTAAGFVRLIPAARVQTNSRGEALVYMRAGAERQVALFFDGALMNVPWDNRIDMSLVPSGAIGAVSVAKGAPSVIYGANTLGGTINMVSADRREQGSMTDIALQAGSGEQVGATLSHIGRRGSVSYIGEVGYASRRGFAVPGSAALPYHQSPDALRTNTDTRSTDLYLRVENEFSEDAELGAALHFTDAEKGVAPEGHTADARFWRYPTWRNLTVSINGELRFGDDAWSLRGAAWTNRFAQDIEQFDDARYAERRALEEDRDFTFGARTMLTRALGEGRATLAVNALASRHEQRDFAYDSGGTTGTVSNATYAQQTYSVGAEIEQRFGRVLAIVGAGFDAMRTPRTGDKPKQDPFGDYGVTMGASYEVDDAVALRVSAGRKTRFPTMRELYGEALRRFLINPDLKPEESWVAEVGAELHGAHGGLSLTSFIYETANTIDQRAVDTLGSRKRQRINLPGSHAIGGEIAGSLRVVDRLRVDGHVSYVYTRGEATASDGSDSTFVLSEKPDVISTVNVSYSSPIGIVPSAEIVYTGTAFSPGDDGALVELAASSVVNLRLSYRLTPWNATVAEIFLRLNNATDALAQPQLGLPEHGRELIAGLKLAF
jgi:iron complex outermembrane receptor protein